MIMSTSPVPKRALCSLPRALRPLATHTQISQLIPMHKFIAAGWNRSTSGFPALTWCCCLYKKSMADLRSGHGRYTITLPFPNTDPFLWLLMQTTPWTLVPVIHLPFPLPSFLSIDQQCPVTGQGTIVGLHVHGHWRGDCCGFCAWPLSVRGQSWGNGWVLAIVSSGLGCWQISQWRSCWIFTDSVVILPALMFLTADNVWLCFFFLFFFWGVVFKITSTHFSTPDLWTDLFYINGKN